MKSAFVVNENVSKFADICRELESTENLIGPSLGIVSGEAGRGKTEAAKHFAAGNSTIYIPPLLTRTPTMLLRTICFELCKASPNRSDECISVIATEMAKERRLIIIDEADLLVMQVLEMLRNVGEMYSIPLLLIGEGNKLEARIASRRRLSSRVRRKLDFGPITQADVLQFFKKALDVKLSSEVCSLIHRSCEGNWRPLLVKAAALERVLKASRLTEITTEMVKELN